MNRVSSAMIPGTAMANLGRAQLELVEAARQSSAQTKATSLKGYGRDAQTLVSAERLVARTQSFLSTGRELTTRMQIQDVALGRAAEAVSKLKEDLFQNVGLDSGEGVRSQLEEAFAVLKDAMNTNIGGRFLFGGMANDRPPVRAASLSDLGANPLADMMETGASVQEMRIEEGRIIAAGVVADDVISQAMASIKRLVEADEGPDGPFGGDLSANQRQALENELGVLSAAFDTILQAQAENGRLSKQVETAMKRQDNNLLALKQAVGDIVNVDLAEVAVRLSQAQYAYEASAGVFNTLRGMSLLNMIDL